MSKKKAFPPHLADWAIARARYHLSHAHVQMGRELGMNPKKLGGKANHRQEPWKAPLPILIEDLYEKRFGVRCPASVKSLEEVAHAAEEKRRGVKREKEARRQAESSARAVRADELGFSVQAVVDGRGDVLDIQDGDMAHRLSDALLELAKPYVEYPPRQGDRHLLETAVRFAAGVWNVTLIADDAARASALLELARATAQTSRQPEDEVIGVVHEIAARKAELFPSDERFVVRVGVEVRGKDMLVTAGGTHRVRGRVADAILEAR